MKKIILILLSILFCFSFSSCTSSKNIEGKPDVTDGNSVISNNSNIEKQKNSTSQNNDNNDIKDKVTYQNKTVSNIQLDFNGYRTNLGTEDAQELFNLESLEEAESAEFGMELGSIIIIYENGDEERFANVYMGKDKDFYLQLENDNSKTYKLADSSIMNDLL